MDSPRDSSLVSSVFALILLILGVLACGCASGDMHVQARVTSAACGAAETPASGASVVMACPQVLKASGRSELGKTDGRGELTLDEPLFGRWIHDGCDLVVEKPGYEPKRFHVANVCKRYSANHCTQAVVIATMTPVGACP